MLVPKKRFGGRPITASRAVELSMMYCADLPLGTGSETGHHVARQSPSCRYLAKWWSMWGDKGVIGGAFGGRAGRIAQNVHRAGASGLRSLFQRGRERGIGDDCLEALPKLACLSSSRVSAVLNIKMVIVHAMEDHIHASEIVGSGVQLLAVKLDLVYFRYTHVHAITTSQNHRWGRTPNEAGVYRARRFAPSAVRLVRGV